MLIDFLTHTCTITQDVKVNDNWDAYTTQSTVYSNIPCHLYSIWWGYQKTQIWLNTDNTKTKLTIQADKLNVRQGQTVEVSTAFWVIWKFIIDIAPKENYISWQIDCITLVLKNI